MPSIYIEENFLNKEQCKNVISWLEDNTEACYSKDDSIKYESLFITYKETVLNGRTIYFDNDIVTYCIEHFWNIIKKEKQKFKSQFSMVTKSYPGTVLNDHYDLADHENQEPGSHVSSTKKVKTFVLYLNDEYDGGILHIENRLFYKPSAGSFILFDGSNFNHGVSEVKNSPRYSIVATFATT